jgi:hypothetical protein
MRKRNKIYAIRLQTDLPVGMLVCLHTHQWLIFFFQNVYTDSTGVLILFYSKRRQNNKIQAQKQLENIMYIFKKVTFMNMNPVATGKNTVSYDLKMSF